MSALPLRSSKKQKRPPKSVTALNSLCAHARSVKSSKTISCDPEVGKQVGQGCVCIFFLLENGRHGSQVTRSPPRAPPLAHPAVFISNYPLLPALSSLASSPRWYAYALYSTTFYQPSSLASRPHRVCICITFNYLFASTLLSRLSPAVVCICTSRIEDRIGSDRVDVPTCFYGAGVVL